MFLKVIPLKAITIIEFSGVGKVPKFCLTLEFILALYHNL